MDMTPEEHAAMGHDKKTSILPLVIILGAVVAVSAVWAFAAGATNFMAAARIFMGVFFVTFAGFKLIDIKGFADAYATYDVVAKKIPAYGFFYPFIELWLGINYLLHLIPRITDWVTLVVMGVSSVGVLLALKSKKPFRCACLGTKLNVPMTTVTLLEDVVMTIMAGLMLWFY